MIPEQINLAYEGKTNVGKTTGQLDTTMKLIGVLILLLLFCWMALLYA